MSKLIDAFMFAGEMDVLDIRLHELDPIVDYFVIVESCEPHGASGVRQPTYLADPERWREVTAPFSHKIHYVTLDKLKPEYTDSQSGWARENFHRAALMQEIRAVSASPDDVAIVSDADEIPRADALKVGIPQLRGVPCYLSMDMFMYNVNSYLEPWTRSYMGTVKMFEENGGTQPPRGHLDQTATGACVVLKNAGWHFSSFMSLRRLREKLRNFAHSSDFPHLADISEAGLAHSILSPRNIFTGKFLEERSSDDPRLPQYFLENRERFRNLTREALAETHSLPDITIAVIRGMDWTTLAPYANSLARCGFKGMKTVFVEQEPQEVIDNLRRLGFIVIPRTPATYSEADRKFLPENLAYGYHRFAPVIEFLKNNVFRSVIWTDVRDVVFQTDPVPFLETISPAQIVFSGLSHTSADCKYNDRWGSQAAQDDALWSELRKQEALACGTFAGAYEAILDLMQDMYEGCVAQPGTVDQGMFNCLARTSPYKEIIKVPGVDEPFAAQWWPEKRSPFGPPIIHSADRDPVFDEKTGEVRTAKGELYPIVHLYERSTKWLDIMRKKYA